MGAQISTTHYKPEGNCPRTLDGDDKLPRHRQHPSGCQTHRQCRSPQSNERSGNSTSIGVIPRPWAELGCRTTYLMSTYYLRSIEHHRGWLTKREDARGELHLFRIQVTTRDCVANRTSNSSSLSWKTSDLDLILWKQSRLLPRFRIPSERVISKLITRT